MAKAFFALSSNFFMWKITEEIEQYRDRKWRREDSLRIKTAEDIENMVDDIGFCLGLTDERKRMPSVYIAVCGRRDAHMPRNVQKDPEASTAWVLKDEVIALGRIYYGKIYKGHSMFVSRRLVPAFNSVWGCSKAGEAGILSKPAQTVLKVLRKEWEMATSDLREACGFKDKNELSKALDELQKRMKVVPQEVAYSPKFTYIWTTAEARFPKELSAKIKREDAIREIARAYLSMCGRTLVGELAGKFSLSRRDAGKANHELVDEGFAECLDNGVYQLTNI
ncbi:MAG: hypothetical protein KF685_04095 [Acidobacteria bacterium]|nr:hypothetical protein [Acidobacteriota bacterium]